MKDMTDWLIAREKSIETDVITIEELTAEEIPTFTIKEQLAINEKCKELRWI